MKLHYLYIALAIAAAILYGRMAWVMVEKTAAERIDKKVQASIDETILADRKARADTPQIVVTQTVNLADDPKAVQSVKTIPQPRTEAQQDRAAYTPTQTAYTPPPITNVYITNPPMAETPKEAPQQEPAQVAQKTTLQEAQEIVHMYDPTGTVQEVEDNRLRIYAFNGKDATLDLHDGWQETLKGVLNKIK